MTLRNSRPAAASTFTTSTLRTRGLLAPCLGLGALTAAHAQVEREYLARTQPYAVYQAPETAKYNLKLGKLTAHFSGNVQMEVNDNINLSDTNPQTDFSIGPQVGVGFLWPLTRNHVMQMDMGLGYRWYLKNADASSISVSPHTHLDYTIFIENVRITLHDRFSIQVDPLSRPELSGNSGKVTAFRRVVNASGLVADYQATRALGVFGGYDFALDRSLTSQFQDLDRNDHSFSAGLNYALSSRVKAGLAGSYGFSEYERHVQNDGSSHSFGPTLSVRLSKFLSATASAGYTEATYQRSGTIADDSSYRGPSYNVALEHTLNQRTKQSLRFGQSVGAGLGSNFTDTKVLQYGLNTSLTKAISLNVMFAYENLLSSLKGAAVGENASRYLMYLGSGYQFTRNWSVGLSYSFSVKESNLPARDYAQNRLTMDFTRRF